MAENLVEGTLRRYDVKICTAGDLSDDEIAGCIALLTDGGAVKPRSARVELPRAQLLAVARTENNIVGVGAIKRIRAEYAAGKAKLSGAVLAPQISELGYVAVDQEHRDQHLSTRLVDELLKNHSGPLYATTDSVRMKATLEGAGFEQRGHEWGGRRGRLSLWVKE